MRYINIATEDPLSEAVAKRLVGQFTNFKIGLPPLGRKGNGHLRANLKSYFEIGKREPFLLITDLDQIKCPPNLISSWKRSVNIPAPDNFLFRVAVREVEAWILADHTAMERLFKTKNFPVKPDSLDDPKRELLSLAKKAPRNIREAMVVMDGAIASQGLEYNSTLVPFVENVWCPVRAATRSNSLNRACVRLQELERAFS
jgi:hypothetical protein